MKIPTQFILTRLTPVLAIVLGACGCAVVDSDEPGSTPSVSILTDEAVHLVSFDSLHQSHSLRIPISISNNGNGTVYLDRCGALDPSPVLQKNEGDRWVNALLMPCNLVASPPIAVEPASTYSYVVQMAWSLRANSYPRFSVDGINGTYRFVYSAFAIQPQDGPDGRDALPLEDRSSRSFDLLDQATAVISR